MAAEMIFEGKVTGSATVSVLAPFGGIVDEVRVRAGDRITQGAGVAAIKTTRVYAPAEGVVSGVFGREGDATEGISERYGAVLFVEPVNKYTIFASTEKAYNVSENKFIHIGEEVYLCCTADGSHQGTGVVTAVEAEGKYKVEVTGGEFCMDETVGIFRKPGYPSSSRIGRGTVAATAAVAVKGSGSILKMHVANGDMVERGELLFETVEGTLDGLFSPGNEVLCDVTGIVSNIDAAAGTAVEKGAKLITVYPDDALQVEVPVLESDLSAISVDMPVRIEFGWDPEQDTRMDGVVTHISYVNGAESGEPSYTAYVHFTPDETVRLGMTVLVYALGDTDAPANEIEGE